MITDADDDDEQDFPEGMDFFIRAEPLLEAFAEEHSLQIRKYYHAQANWDFFFLHPRGGTAHVQLLLLVPADRRLPREILVAGHWHIDDEARHERRLKSRVARRRIPLEDIGQIIAALRDELLAILTWSVNDLTVSPGLPERPRDKAGNPMYSDFETSLTLPVIARGEVR